MGIISLKGARVEAGMTQEELGNAVNVSKTTISAWENGESEPKVSQFRTICKVLNRKGDEIFLPNRSN